MTEKTKELKSEANHGVSVVIAGVGINLALGILYTWSVISGAIPEKWGWDQGDKALPYSICCLVFCLVMVPAGRMQDKLSPRLTASLGGVLVGAGFILASLMARNPDTALVGFVIGFGVLAGAGIGFGYASATPPAVKWFPPEKTGMIAGIVVSGFGLASVYAAPLAKWLSANYGLERMMLVLGIAFLVVVVGLAQLLKTPHKVQQFIKGYNGPGHAKLDAVAEEKAELVMVKKENFTPKEMLGTVQFYMLWFMYACGAGAGLMIISVAMKIAKGGGMAENIAVAAVVGLAIGNGGGRIVSGFISDKLGRKATLLFFLLFQAALIFLLSKAQGDSIFSDETRGPALIIIIALIGANYGSNLALFPSITKDYFGIKNFGVNYGLVFTAWGVGGFMLAKLAGKMYDKYETFNVAFYGASALLILAAIMVLFVKPPHHTEEAV